MGDLVVLTDEEGQLREFLRNFPEPPSFPLQWWEPSPVNQPAHWPCMFDGLPPGVYGLVCTCPRCSPRCG